MLNTWKAIWQLKRQRLRRLIPFNYRLRNPFLFSLSSRLIPTQTIKCLICWLFLYRADNCRARGCNRADNFNLRPFEGNKQRKTLKIMLTLTFICFFAVCNKYVCQTRPFSGKLQVSSKKAAIVVTEVESNDVREFRARCLITQNVNEDSFWNGTVLDVSIARHNVDCTCRIGESIDGRININCMKSPFIIDAERELPSTTRALRGVCIFHLSNAN